MTSRAVADPPMCRATLRAGQLSLNPWTPALLNGGPATAWVANLPVALVDVYAGADDELIVSRVPGSRWDEKTAETLLEWAAGVGYRVVWLPDRVVAVDPSASVGRLVGAVCSTCGACWADETPEFWVRVRARHGFPRLCLACGGSLPEWTESRTAALVAESEGERREVLQR